MKPCWVCRNNIKTDRRVINCDLCHGHVVTLSDQQVKRLERRERERKELERMMSARDTYERRRGVLKQKRRASDWSEE